MPYTTRRLSPDRISAAVQVIDPVFLNTPQYHCEALDGVLEARLTLKIETLNPIRSFKGRGAELLMAGADPGRPLVCGSAGNFGQAMAYSARKRGLSLTVYAAVNASPLKLDRMRALGARVILHGEDFDAAKLEARRFAQQTGARMVEDSLDPETAEGAGTIGLELLRLPEPLDVLLVPLGNGAMINGIALALKTAGSPTRIVAVQAEGAPAMTESWRSGERVAHAQVQTVSDGIAVRLPVPEALEDMRGMVDDALLVSDAATLRGLRLLHQHAGVVPEPSAAVGVAALLEHAGQFRGASVGTIVCGSNLTPEQMQQWLA